MVQMGTNWPTRGHFGQFGGVLTWVRFNLLNTHSVFCMLGIFAKIKFIKKLLL